MTEEWRPIATWERFYEVSNLGRVRSLRRAARGGAGTRTLPGKILKPWVATGHLYVSLTDRPRVERLLIHRLVLEAFVGPCPEGMEALHWDDDPTNNRVENLRWGTRSQNLYDAVRNGKHWQTRKDACPRGHLLVSPNLIASSLRRGSRDCLACGKARSFAKYHHLEFTQELADQYYNRIINTEAAAAA